MKIWLDFETFSEINIKKAGLYNHIYHPSFDVLCLAYAVDDGNVYVIKPEGIDKNMERIQYLSDTYFIYAHNVEFEYNVFKRRGFEIPLKRFIDTMALAGTFGYPLELDKFVKAVGLPHGKTAQSTRLLNKLSCPKLKTIKDPTTRWTPETAPEDFNNLYIYCRNDVHIMREAVKRLPFKDLTPFERLVWAHTIMQNERGMQIDINAVHAIVQKLLAFKKEGEAEFYDLTGLTSVKQVAKLKDYFWNQGVKIPNLQADTIKMYLNTTHIKIPDECKRVLQLRQELAYSSTAKFDKMIAMINKDGRVRGSLAYHVAHTGRWGGRGVQIHNLPRYSHKDPDAVIKDFLTQPYPVIKHKYPDMNKVASGLVRPVIIAPDGKKLCVGDYSSIENIVLHWGAGDDKTTQDFRNGLCQYKVYSSMRLNKPYDKITKEERQQSKPDVLGLGYGAGYKALIGVAAQYGVNLGKNEALNRVRRYRRIYKEVVRFWNNVYTTAKLCVLHKEQKTLCTPNIELTYAYDGRNLWVRLPSGRYLHYKDVLIDAVWYITVKNKKVPMTSEISYMGIKNNQLMRIGTHPGMMVENIVQAIARDCLAYGLLNVEQAGYKVIGSVHDEIITEIDENGSKNIKKMCEIMCRKKDWYKTLPLQADGWEGYRYKKD